MFSLKTCTPTLLPSEEKGKKTSMNNGTASLNGSPTGCTAGTSLCEYLKAFYEQTSPDSGRNYIVYAYRAPWV